MLQDRELIGVAFGILQQALYERRLGRHTACQGRALDRLLLLDPSEARDEVVPVVQPFGQAAENGTFSQIVRSHREHDINGAVGSLTDVRSMSTKRAAALPPSVWSVARR